MNYKEFLKQKQAKHIESGFDVSEESLNGYLFDFQRHIVKTALRKGKYAIFADCGLGKTLMQLEWARQVALHTNTQTITGGESIYGFFTNVNAATSQDLTLVRDIGNSILGGGTSLTVPSTPANLYPDGPDVITVVATPLVNGSVINARISWTEAQA